MTSALAVNSQPAAARVRLEPRVASRRLVRVRAPRGRDGGAREAPIDPPAPRRMRNNANLPSLLLAPRPSLTRPTPLRLPIADVRPHVTRRGVVACSLAGAGAPDHDAPSEPHRKQMEIDSSRPKSVLADLHSVAQPRTDNRVAKTAAAVALGSASLLAAHATLPPAVPCVGVGVARAGTFSHQKDHTLGDVLYYRFQNIFALPLPGKILCLVAFTVPVVFAGAVAYKVVDALNAKLEPAGGDDSNEPESWTDALANSFYLLNNVPGADATTDEWDTPGGARRGFVTQCIVFIGLFVFAIIIGIISDEITAQVEDVKTGNNKVVEYDHTVIVNWNSQLLPLLKQMAVAKSERAGTFDRPVVLLADVDKETMDEAIGEALEESPPLRVVTRRGNPFDAEDLARVNAFAAKRVIILHPHEDEVGLLGQGVHARDESDESAGRIKELQFQREQREEALKATVILNLLNDKAHANPDVVVQMPYRLPNEQDLVGHALKITKSQDARSMGQIPSSSSSSLSSSSSSSSSFEMSAPKEGSPRTRYVQVHGTENTGKISAFAAFQPGIARVFEVLFEQDDATPEFYLSNAPQFTGVPFADAWRMLPRATLCGVSHADGSVTLAPDDAYVIRADDEVVLLAESSSVDIVPVGESFAPRKGSERYYMKALSEYTDADRGPKKILFAGYNDETLLAVKLARDMAPNGSEITILAETIPADEFEQFRSTPNCKLRVIKGVPSSHEHLKSVPVSAQDSVVIMPAKDLGSKAEEDATVLATILQTYANCELRRSRAPDPSSPEYRNPHVVAALNTDSARSIAELMGTVDTAHVAEIPDVIMSDDLIGGVLLQVSANPRLASLFDALLATEGHECYIRDADLYGGADTRAMNAESDTSDEGPEGSGKGLEGGGSHEGAVRWGVVCERARERDELAMGVMRADGEMVISPAKDATFVFEEGDRIIVLADSL